MICCTVSVEAIYILTNFPLYGLGVIGRWTTYTVHTADMLKPWFLAETDNNEQGFSQILSQLTAA